MINERVANFFKLQFSDKKFLFIPIGNLRVKSENKKQEDDRTKRIIAINIISGTAIAIMLNADLINLLGHLDKPYTALGWDHSSISTWYDFLIFLLGCSLTGCFISLGSKFWHDLLDMLMYAKNLKGKLVDDQTYRQTIGIDPLRDFIVTPEYKFTQIAVDAFASELKAIKGVLNVGPGYLQNGSSKIGCVEVHVTSDEIVPLIRSRIPIRLVSGAESFVPTKVIVTRNYPKVNSANAGAGIGNKSGVLGKGTIGAIVKDAVTNEKYILSCFHVLNGDINFQRMSNATEIIDDNGMHVADLYFGYRTTEIDAAIAKLIVGVNYSNDLINNPTSIRPVTFSDVLNEVSVTVLGAKTAQKSTGFIYNDSFATALMYPDGKLWQLNDLFVITKVDERTNSYKAITKSGDSGALVLDNRNQAIGLVVGADNAFTYAIKLDKIAKNMDIKL